MKKISSIVFLFILFFGCNNPYPNYKKVQDDVYMQLISFGEEEFIAQGDIVHADIKIYDGTKLIYHNFKENKIEITHPLYFLFSYLSQGDSAIFKIQNQQLATISESLNLNQTINTNLELRIKVFQFVPSIEKNIIDPEMKEQLILNQYLNENEVYKVNLKQGIYSIVEKEGKGKRIDVGSVIQIQYKASFTNYVQFDNTYDKALFEFTYGTPGQVIEGLNIALKGMRKGEKSKIIISSHFAFGEEGSTTGIVPPYSTLVYDLEIINVK